MGGWVGVCGSMSGWVCITKTPDRNNLKIGTVVVFNTVLQLIFSSRRQG